MGATQRTHIANPAQKRPMTRFTIILLLVAALTALPASAFAAPVELLNVNFNSTTNGFTYADDTFGTSQPSYASGARTATGGYSGTGGLQVTLGGVNNNAITGMSGGWNYTLNLANAENGVSLSFRYKLEQTATYEFDEYSRVLVKVDGTQYGRSSTKNYVDHIGGDGSSAQGNSNTFLPTTDWQQVDIYVGNLTAGNHTIVLGGYNNKKDALDESTTLVIDDVIVTSGNPALVPSAAQTLTGRVDINQFLTNLQGIAQFHDRCRGNGMGCSSTDYTTNYMNALAWVEAQLQSMGYTTVRHVFALNGGGTNLYATKTGSVTPTQMYMVSMHLDARSNGDGFDDDGSGVALVLEVARVLAGADVTTDKSVRFIFWDKEETGLNGSSAYASNDTANGGRRALQGTLAEPTWLGIIQHDMILYDHGAGSVTPAQSAYADLDVEWRAGTAKEADSRALALKWAYANGAYAPDYPATAYNYSTNTDDTPFHPYTAAISVRENRRNLTSGSNAEWINPYYHTVNDKETSYNRDDNANGKRDDIELGYNAVRTTLGLVAELAGAHIVSANGAPTANPQSVTTDEDVATAITLTGSDPDSNPLTFAVATGPANGALTGTAPNLTYTPNPDFNGGDSFTFTVNDGTVDSAPATVSITVTPVNDPPVATPQTVTVNEGMSTSITLSGTDADGGPLTYAVTSSPAHGALTGTAPNLTYTPDPGYSGPDSFTFTVHDGTVASAPATVSITVTHVNHPPVADAGSAATPQNTPVNITLSGYDPDGDALTYSVMTAPTNGALSGLAPNLTYTPNTDYTGSDSFTFTVNDGAATSDPATFSLAITMPGLALPFVDDFETDLGWVVNPAGADGATGGVWQRAIPQPTESNGPKQLGVTVSGVRDLVTGALAGSNAGTNDVDGGVTSIRSPWLMLPSGQDITLSLSYYLAHAQNSSIADFLRVRVVGDTTATVFNVSGANVDVDAAWTPYTVSLNSFAGQTVYLLIEAADGANATLVEAAIDDLSVTASAPSPTLLSAAFDGGADGFVYADDAFRETAQPDYADGAHLPAGGFSGGALQVTLGGLDDAIITDISGGWSAGFTLPADGPITVSFWYRLTQSPDYDGDEMTQALAGLDGTLLGASPNDFLAQITGNGNGGIAETTGWQLFSITTAPLPAGGHTLTIGGYNNKKSYNNESSEILIDQVQVIAP